MNRPTLPAMRTALMLSDGDEIELRSMALAIDGETGLPDLLAFVRDVGAHLPARDEAGNIHPLFARRLQLLAKAEGASA